jgi:HK97 family phage major capsid protein
MKKDDFLKICRTRAKKELTPEEESFFSSIGEGIEQAIQGESIERSKKLEEISNLIGVVEEGKSIAEVIRGLAASLDEVEANSKKRLSVNDKYLMRKALEGKKNEILAVMRKQSNTPWGLEFNARRAASAMMTTSTVLTGAQAINTENVFDDMDVTVIKYPANFIGDVIDSRQVSKVPAVLRWKEQIAAGDGVPAVVAEGDVKPLVDYKFSWKYANRKKYAAHIEMTEETEIDFEQLVLDIIQMFEDDVLRKYNAGLLADVLAWAPAYAGTSLDGTIVKPTLQNVFNAGQLQLATAEYIGDVFVVNPSAYAEIQNMQDNNGNPIFVNAAVLFPGVRVVVTNNIPAETALLMDGRIVKEQHGSFVLRSGTINDQLIENEKTIIGEIFSVMKLPTESKKGAVKLTIATVKEALKVAQA